jgi:hexosaminidase
MRKLFAFSLLIAPILLSAQVNIIPQPVEVKMPATAGSFTITARTPIILEGSGLENSAAFLNDYLQMVYGFKLKVQKNASAGGIRLNYERMDHPIPGAYNLEVRKDAILINGDNANGVFYGMQSLIQLLPVDQHVSLPVPFVSIKDYPRFSYRGLHLDVGRHFFPVEFVKKYIDYIALHKMNTFHWHLTEDQGWRIEIKKYPKLTSVGGYRDGTIIGRYPGKGNDNTRYGGFYTQAQVKEVVAYAAKRYIDVIPEIEMPGHSSAALTAYPNLGCTGGPYKVQQTWGVFKDVFCAGNDTVYKFLEDVLDEVIPLFPAKYVHIGGDECPKDSWKTCPKCQKRIKDHNLKDEHELQSYFVQRMEKYINKKGKIMIGWDEILEGGLAPNAVVMSWRGEAGGIEAAKQNHDVIMTPGSHVYLDHSQTKNEDSVTIGGHTTVQKTYSYEPVPKELNAEQAKHVLGAQGNVWTEYMKYPSKVEYMIFPRLSALSEVLWSPKEKRDWNDFEKRLQMQFKRYEIWKANYSKAYFDLKASILPNKNFDGVEFKLESPMVKDNVIMVVANNQIMSWQGSVSMQIPNIAYDPDGSKGAMKDSSINLSHYKYTSPVPVGRTEYLFGGLFEKKGNDYKELNSVHQFILFNKATGRKINLLTPASPKYPGSGAFTLVNGVVNEKGLGDADSFLGFEGTDMEAVIDLGSIQKIEEVEVYCLDEPGSWIYHPRSVEISLSKDGNNFSVVEGRLKPADERNRSKMYEFQQGDERTETRYVKVLAKNYGPIPEGSPGAGNKAWLFIDEIQVN